ncbi:type II toxin-antitoxin system VapC family toxin [Streptomyces sp. NPDC002845]
MLIVDSGPLVAFLNRNDPDHERCADLLESYDGDLVVTPYVLTECCYLVAKYLGAEAEINLVESVVGGDLVQVFPDERDMGSLS